MHWNKKDILLYFKYTQSLAHFGAKFHQVWQEIFEENPLSDISVIFAHCLTDNFKSMLVHNEPLKTVIKSIVENLERWINKNR
jgi:hypothetical protein